MAEDVNIKAKVSVDTAGASKSIADFNKEIKEAKKAMNEAKIGSDEYVKAQKKLADSQKELETATKSSTKGFGTLKESLTGMGSPLEGAKEGLGKFRGALDLLRANPIVFVITAIVGVLIALMTKSKDVKESFGKLGDSLSKFSDIIKNVIGFVLKPFIFIITKLIDGITWVVDKVGSWVGATKNAEEAQADLKEATDELNESLDEQDAAIDAATKRMQKHAEFLGKTQKEIEKIGDDGFNKKKQLLLDEFALAEKMGAKGAEFEKFKADRLDKLQQEYEDKEISKRKAHTTIKEHIEKKSGNKIVDTKIEAEKTANEQLQKLIDENYLLSIKDEFQKREASARLALEKDLEDIRLMNISEDLKRSLKIEKRKIFDAELIKINEDAKIKELADKKKHDDELAAQDAIHAERLKEARKKIDDEKAAKDKENADKALAIAKLEADGKAALLGNIGTALTSVSDVVGKNTVAGKAMSIATALMNTYQGISKGVSMGMPWGIPSIVAAAAVGFKTVKDIVAVNVPGQSSGGGMSTPSLAMPPIAPTQATTQLNQGSINAIGNAAAGGINRAFVLSSDISSDAERNARLNRAARLG